MTRPLGVATRGSVLARAQTDSVVAWLGVDATPIVVATAGDRAQDRPIHAIGGTGVFVKEVQEAVLDGRADVAVHSAKDLPARAEDDSLVIGAFPERADPRDALVGSTLADLPTGAVVATGSVRRRAQLVATRPDLVFAELRGNVPTRLEKAHAFDAIVVAAAALERLGMADNATEVLDPSVMLPQVGQGALAVECRADDDETREMLAAIDDPAVRAAVEAERAYLAELGGGCDLPVGALGRWFADGTVTLTALLASLDGRVVLRATGTGAASDPEPLGREVAARLLGEQGGSLLLDDLGVGA